MLPEVEPEGDDDEPLVEPDEPLAVPVVDVSVLLVPVVPLALEVEDGLVVGDVAVEPEDGLVVVEVEDGVVAVVAAPVPVEVLLAGRSQPVANAAANARAAVSEISFMSAPWFGGGTPLHGGAEDAMEESAQRMPTLRSLRGGALRQSYAGDYCRRRKGLP